MAMAVDYLLPIPAFCGFRAGCDEVTQSAYGSPLGIPLPFVGLLSFGGFFVVTVFSSRFPVGQGQFRVPTLGEMVELIQGLNASTGRQVGLYPEMKAPSFHKEAGQDIVQALLEVIDQAGYRQTPDEIILQCFESAPLKRLKKQNVPYQLVQLIGDNGWELSREDYEKMQTKAGLKDIATYADGIGPWMNQIIQVDAEGDPRRTSLVGDAQALGLTVHPYTFRADSLPPYVKSFDELVELFLYDVGVDGLFTDFGDRAVAVRARYPDQAGEH